MFSFFNRTQCRVQRGVRLLESYDPNWFNKVNLNGLRIDSENHCVVAQVLKTDYTTGMYRLGLHPVNGYDYGFFAAGPNWSKAQDRLGEEWQRVIAKKQSQRLEEMVDA